MHKFVLMAVLAVLPAAAYADQVIYHRAVAEAYVPAVDEDDVTYVGVAAWDAVGKTSEVTAHSESHPFDPPSNEATSWSRFSQQDFATGTYRAYSAVVGEYNAIANQPYAARTDFQANYTLRITDPTHIGATVSVIVPMHGLFASRSPNPLIPADARAGASAEITINGTQAYKGEFTVTGATSVTGTSIYAATGDWLGNIQPKVVSVPFGGGQGNGYELSALRAITIGQMFPGTSTLELDIGFAVSTFASIPYANGTYSIADFRGTGGFEIIGRDAGGNLVPLIVTAVAVPEPGALAIVAGGIVMLGLRRRRKVA